MVNGQTPATAGQEHENKLDLFLSIQNDINYLKAEYASTLNQLSSTLLHLISALSQLAELQHDMRAVQEELRKEKNESYRKLERRVIRLKKSYM